VFGRGIVPAIEADLAGVLESRRQTVESDVAPDATKVSGDPAKLQDALRNLLENATNHAPRAAASSCGRGAPAAGS
jgi:signal transduction histidine kinase